MIDELSEPEKKTGMVEQLGREVYNIWYYVARKKHDVAQSNIVYAIWNKKKKDVGDYA